MGRKAKIKPILLLLTAAAIVFFLYNLTQNQGVTQLYPVVSSGMVQINQSDDLHFFSEGLITCGTASQFFNWNGEEIEPPFHQDDFSGENKRIDIRAHSLNYIVTSNNRIYDTNTSPFTMVYENQDHEIWDIKEYTDYLVLLIQNENGLAEPFVLVNNSNFLIPMDGTGKTEYLSADAYGKEVSLLTMSMDAPVPMIRVFHYKNRTDLYGVLSLDNQLIYSIYRLKDKVILIGIKELLCYNMEGELQWSLSHDSEGLFQTLEQEETIILYFPEKDLIGEHKGNTLKIDHKGYKVVTFPKYLSDLNEFGDGYLALESNHTLVFLNPNGNVTGKQRLQETVRRLDRTAQRSNILFVQTEDGMLQWYTTEKQEEVIP